jgi:hypothetical protein
MVYMVGFFSGITHKSVVWARVEKTDERLTRAVTRAIYTCCAGKCKEKIARALNRPLDGYDGQEQKVWWIVKALSNAYLPGAAIARLHQDHTSQA